METTVASMALNCRRMNSQWFWATVEQMMIVISPVKKAVRESRNTSTTTGTMASGTM